MKQTMQSKMQAYAELHAIDREAARIMEQRDCSFSEAWLRAKNGERAQP